MSGEELTRFPITPQERRRTARSNKDVAQAPEELPPQENRRAGGTGDQDKPDRPPHRRHEKEDT